MFHEKLYPTFATEDSMLVHKTIINFDAYLPNVYTENLKKKLTLKSIHCPKMLYDSMMFYDFTNLLTYVELS